VPFRLHERNRAAAHVELDKFIFNINPLDILITFGIGGIWLGLIGFYGFCAGRLSGMGLPAAFVQAAAVAAIGGFLIGLKALIH
jgi:hypothetical protein